MGKALAAILPSVAIAYVLFTAYIIVIVGLRDPRRWRTSCGARRSSLP